MGLNNLVLDVIRYSMVGHLEWWVTPSGQADPP